MTDPRNYSEAWIVQHGAFLRHLAGALFRDGAEDAEQEAWVAALDAPPPRELAGWLVTVTRRLAGRARREAGRRRRRERSVARDEHVPAADAVAARAEIVRLVGEVVAELPEPFRETLLLRYWEGLPPRTIAARMDVPVATVRSRTQRGLGRVRAELERRTSGGESWGVALAAVAGLERVSGSIPASGSLTVLGVAGMNTKALILGAAALLVLSLGVGLGILSALRPGEPADAAAAPTGEPFELLGGAAPDEGAPADEAPGLRGATKGAAPSIAPRVAANVVVRVVDPAGEPVPRAELLGGPDGRSLRSVAMTDDDGRARVTREDELAVLCALAAGWAPTPVYTLAEDTRELVLQVPLRGVPLVVEVRGPSGAPLADARVDVGRREEVDYRLPDGTLARTAPGLCARTDVAGVARFPGLSPGWLRVSAEHAEFARAMQFTTLHLGRENRLAFALEPGLVVAGRVTDARGAPVAGADVRRGSSGLFTTTAADGTYRLGPVDAGKVVVEGPLGRALEKRVSGDPGALVEWSPVLASEPVLRGRVVDEHGAPRVGWCVHLNDDTYPGWRRALVTDAEGRFAFYGGLEQALRLEVRAVAAAPLPLLVREGVEASPDELVLTTGATAARLAGRVQRDVDGEALPLFLRHVTTPGRARLTGGPGRAITLDADGRFALDGVPAGAYELVLEGAPFGWWRLTRVELADGEAREVGTLVVPRTGTLRARTWWGAPEPTGDARYLLERRADQVVVLAFRGAFPEELRLAPGTYTLQTEVTPGPQREQTFEIVSGRSTEIELDLAETCTHRVRVRYASQRAPTGAIELSIVLVDDDRAVVRDRITRIEEGHWLAEVELGSGRFELVARDAQGCEVRRLEDLYTSRPGREVLMVLADVVVEAGPDDR